MLKKRVSSYFLRFLFGNKKKYSVYLQKIFWKGMQSKFPQKSTIYTLFRDGERAGVRGLCLSALLRLSVKMTHIMGFDLS